MRGKLFTLIYLTYFIFFVFPIYGQAPSFYFHHLTMDNDLSSLSNEFVFEDSQGLIWISSNDGLNVFDGKDLVYSYKPDSQQSKGITGTYISSSFFEDRDGNIWFTSYTGINCYNQQNDQYEFFQLEGLGGTLDYYGFHLDQQDNLWLRTGLQNEGQLHIFNTKTKILKNTEIGPIDGRRIKAVTNKAGEVTWLICSLLSIRDFGINLLEINSNRDLIEIKDTLHYDFGGLEIKPKDGYVENMESIWFGSKYNGLIEFNLSHLTHQLHSSNDFQSGSLWDIEPYDENRLFVSSEKGLLIFDINRKKFTQQILTENKFKGELMANDLRGLYKDRHHNLWISQWKKGVSYTNLYKNKFSIAQASKGKEILHLIQNKKKDLIYVSTKQKQVLIYHPNGELLKTIPTDANFQQLFLSANNELWGVAREEYFQLNQSTNQFIKKGKFEKNNTFTNIISTKSGKIYGFILGQPSIFEIKDLGNQLVVEILSDFDYSNIQHFRCYFEDEQDHLFLYDSKGQLYIYENKNKLTLKKTIPIKEEILNFYDIPNSPYILIATNQGLKKLHQETFDFVPLAENDLTLPIQRYYSIIPSGNNELWLPSNNGLVKYNHKTGAYQTYSVADGLQGKTFKRNCALKASDGKIWLGGMNGLNIIDPSKVKELTTQPQIYFSNFLVDKDTISLSQPIDNLSEINLSNSQNTFSIEFVAMDYSDPKSVKAKYRILSSKNEDWILTERHHVIERFDMKGGDYVIEVIAANSDGVWMDEKDAKRISVKIDKHFTETALFRWGLPIGSGLLLFFFLARRSKKRAEEELAAAKKRNQERLAEEERKNKEQLAAEKIKNLEELNQFKNTVYSNITHEFKTPVTIISGYAEFIKGHPKEKNIIQRSSNDILRLINQMLDVSKLESKKLVAEYIQADVISYLKHLIEPSQALANNKGITFTSNFEKDSWTLDYDEQKLEHIVSNLLSNAIKFTPHGGKVDLKVAEHQKEGKDYLKIEVQDTGVGIDHEFHQQIFERHFQIEEDKKINKGGTGIGLAFCKELVELMGGEIQVQSEKGVGSHFTILLPVHNDAVMEEKFYNLETEETEGDTLTLPPTGVNAADTRSVILIVEDNYDVSNFIRSVLGQHYQTIVAYDGEQGIAMAQKFLPDLIVSDVMMPKRNGFEVCEYLKGEVATSHIPLILLTAKDSFKTEIEALSRGADVYIRKPFRSELLQIHITNQLTKLKSLRERYENLSVEGTSEDKAVEIEDRFIKGLREYVENNIEEAKPRDLDKVFNMSTTTLTRKLKTLTALTPSQFIRKIRLQKGKELLETSDERVYEIAFQVGINTPEQFSNEFKSLFGYTPTDYRESIFNKK